MGSKTWGEGRRGGGGGGREKRMRWGLRRREKGGKEVGSRKGRR